MHSGYWVHGVFACWLLIPASLSLSNVNSAFSQERLSDSEVGIEFVRNGVGNVVSINYSGSPDWLVEQKDPRSHWNRHAHLASIAISHTTVNERQLNYISGLRSVKAIHISCLPEEIELPGSALIGLQDMAWLEELDIVNDGFKDDDWKFLHKLENLKALTIRGVVSERIMRDVLNMHNRLKEFNTAGIDGQMNDGTAPVSMPKSLQRLRVGSVRHAVDIVNGACAVGTLQDLEIHGFELDDSEVKLISELRELKRLSLAGQSPDAIRFLRRLDGLRSLRLSFKDEDVLDDLGFLKSFPQLQRLYLLNVSVKDASLDAIKGQSNIEHLEIPKLSLPPGSEPILRSMPKLRYLRTKDVLLPAKVEQH